MTSYIRKYMKREKNGGKFIYFTIAHDDFTASYRAFHILSLSLFKLG